MVVDEYGNQKFFGLYRGTVYDNKDPLDKNRLRVKVPQILGGTVTEWAWPAQSAGAYSTSPGITEGIWVMFEGGDLSFPIWTGTFADSTSWLLIDGGTA